MRPSLWVSCLVLTIGCKREAPPPEATTPPPEPSAAPAPAAEIRENSFEVALRPVGSYSAGTEGAAEIELTPRGGYHCNDKYPYKFKVGDAAGVKYATPVFQGDALHLEEKKATMKVSFTPDSKGNKTIAGTFAFSVCSAERCLVEKRELALEISVN